MRHGGKELASGRGARCSRLPRAYCMRYGVAVGIGGATGEERASCGMGPFHDFYAALLAKGMKPEMARLTLARKIAAITLTLWKKEERFDAEQLKRKQLEYRTEPR